MASGGGSGETYQALTHRKTLNGSMKRQFLSDIYYTTAAISQALQKNPLGRQPAQKLGDSSRSVTSSQSLGGGASTAKRGNTKLTPKKVLQSSDSSKSRDQ
jgi:hypothetical protein